MITLRPYQRAVRRCSAIMNAATDVVCQYAAELRRLNHLGVEDDSSAAGLSRRQRIAMFKRAIKTHADDRSACC